MSLILRPRPCAARFIELMVIEVLLVGDSTHDGATGAHALGNGADGELVLVQHLEVRDDQFPIPRVSNGRVWRGRIACVMGSTSMPGESADAADGAESRRTLCA